MKNKNGLHNKITTACEKAIIPITNAAKGSEASIYNLRFAVADLLSVLIEDGTVIDALNERGIFVKTKGLKIDKYA